MNYTSVEQSKKLLELGLSPESADMTWGEETSDLTKKFEWKVSAGLNVAIKDNLFSYRKGYVLPCWSVGALLNQMVWSNLAHSDKGFWLVYKGPEKKIASLTYDNPIDAVFEIMCYLLENNYIKQ